MFLPTGASTSNSIWQLLTIAGLTITLLVLLTVLKYFVQQITKARNIIR